MQRLEQPLPGLGRQQTARLIATLTDSTCGEACWSAREEVCRCECGGKNHGIQLRGGSGVRACKINGRRYELVAVGNHYDLLKQAQEMVRLRAIESGKAWEENGVTKTISTYGNHGGEVVTWLPPIRLDSLAPFELKYATMAQCLKWKELEYFGIADERDRYKSNAAILWERKDFNA